MAAGKTGTFATCEEAEIRSPLSCHESAQVIWHRYIMMQINAERCFWKTRLYLNVFAKGKWDNSPCVGQTRVLLLTTKWVPWGLTVALSDLGKHCDIWSKCACKTLHYRLRLPTRNHDIKHVCSSCLLPIASSALGAGLFSSRVCKAGYGCNGEVVQKELVYYCNISCEWMVHFF